MHKQIERSNPNLPVWLIIELPEDCGTARLDVWGQQNLGFALGCRAVVTGDCLKFRTHLSYAEDICQRMSRFPLFEGQDVEKDVKIRPVRSLGRTRRYQISIA